jgi:DNA polymerase III subunit gamma/tau
LEVGFSVRHMSYQVIARRWRPQRFSELVGQDAIVRTLTNALTSGRLAHAYLFVGPRGTGKTTTARLLAMALNCEGGPKADFDPTSPVCKSIADGSSMDVIEIDGASNNSVDQVRALREEAQYAPTQGKFKIYIIDEVHMLSTAAFNALLKTLEEPPAHVKFIFATTESHKVLPTIVSRCQRLEFRPIADAPLINKLKEIAVAEGVKVEDAAFSGIATLAAGGMRDAQSILDQLIAFEGKTVTEAGLREVYGLASEAEMASLSHAVAAGDYAGLVGAVEAMQADNRDLYRVWGRLTNIARETVMEAAQKGSSKKMGVVLTRAAAQRIWEALLDGETGIKFGADRDAIFEATLLKAAEAPSLLSVDAMLDELEGGKNAK